MRTPQAVLSWVRGSIPQAHAMTRAFRELRWQRMTDRAGYVLIQNYYLYAERAASRQRVCLWLYDDALRIDYRDEVLATYPCTQGNRMRIRGQPRCGASNLHSIPIFFAVL